MSEGTVKWYNEAKGFGCIVREQGPDVYVSRSNIAADNFGTLLEGEKVWFDITKGPKGLEARNVTRIK